MVTYLNDNWQLEDGGELVLYKDEKDAFQQTYKEGGIFEPDPERQKKYEDYYRVFKKIYPSLKEVNHDIFNRFKS